MSAEATRRLYWPGDLHRHQPCRVPGRELDHSGGASNKVKRALFINEIATPGDGARDGRLLLRIDQNERLGRLQ